MSLYKYNAPSPLDEIVFATTENGSIRAYLHAREGIPREKLQSFNAALLKENLQTVPFMMEGKNSEYTPMLEVRGFASEQALAKTLDKVGAVRGKPKVEKVEEHSTLWQKIQKRSLQVSGLLYAVGDWNFFEYGRKEGNAYDMAAGIVYAMGTGVLAFFGRNDQSRHQVEEKAKALEQFLIKDNVRIPLSCSLHATAEEKEKSWLGHAYDWACTHPSELFNTIYIGAGACIMGGAIHGKMMKEVVGETREARFNRLTAASMDVALGATTSGVSLLGNVIQEKKRDPDEPPPKDWLGKAWAWIQEKPLRVTGYGLMGSTLFHAGSTTVEYFNAKKHNDTKTLAAVGNRATFVLTNMLAEALIAISSKGHGEGVTSDDSVKESVYALAAELIAQQPANKRQELVTHLAGFLQQPNVLAEAYGVVENKLRVQVQKLETNPWVCMDTPARAVVAAPPPASTVTVANYVPPPAAQPALRPGA